MHFIHYEAILKKPEITPTSKIKQLFTQLKVENLIFIPRHPTCKVESPRYSQRKWEEGCDGTSNSTISTSITRNQTWKNQTWNQTVKIIDGHLLHLLLLFPHFPCDSSSDTQHLMEPVALENSQERLASSKHARHGAIVSQLRKLRFPLMIRITCITQQNLVLL